MGNNIFSVRLNTAALAAAHSFLSSHEQYGIQTQRVWVERAPGTAVRLHALDGHHYICFLLREGNPSGTPFQTFGFRLTPAELRCVFNGPKFCTESVDVYDLDGSSPKLRAGGTVMPWELSLASDAPDFRKFWVRLDEAGDPPCRIRLSCRRRQRSCSTCGSISRGSMRPRRSSGVDGR